jgi:hypothetical protein
MESFTKNLVHQLVSGTIQARRIRWYGYVTHMEGSRNLCQISIGKPEWKIQLEKPKC